MQPTLNSAAARPRIAFGPRLPDNGSWTWIGEDLATQAARDFDVSTWSEHPDDCDVIVFVKSPATLELLNSISERSALVYFAVDYFQSEDHITATEEFLRRCSRIVISCEELRTYLECFAPTELLEHHVKYALPTMVRPNPNGPILWTGARSNLGPLVDWVNAHSLPRQLLVLTNPAQPVGPLDARVFGFRDPSLVSIDRWSPQRHLDALREASASLDVKGSGFAQNHKPPTKAVDFLAAGLPFAVNTDASPARYLKDLGFDAATPTDIERWFSIKYFEECIEVGALLRERLDINRIGFRFRRMIRRVLEERNTRSDGSTTVSPRNAHLEGNRETIYRESTMSLQGQNRADAVPSDLDRPCDDNQKMSPESSSGRPAVPDVLGAVPITTAGTPSMAVLLLAHVDLLGSRLDRTHYLRYQALVNSRQVTLFGPGIPGYQERMTVDDAIRVACGGRRPDWILHGLDPRSSGIPLVRGLADCGIPTAYEFGDSWTFREHQAQFINGQRFSVAFIMATRDIPYYQSACPDTQFVFLPYAVDTTLFRDHGEPKQYDVLIYGCTNPAFYPLRNRIAQAVDHHDKFRVRHIKHPGYYPEGGWNGASVIAGEELSRAIGQAWISIATQSVFQVLLTKYLEIGASKAVVAGDMPMDGRAFFGNDYVDLSSCKDDEAIVKTLAIALSDKDRLTAMASRVHRSISEELSVDRYVTRVLETLSLCDKLRNERSNSSAQPAHQVPSDSTPVAKTKPVVGLLITKDDHEVFGDWCESQLAFYEAVVCLDGSTSPITRRIAEEYPEQIIYLHESQFTIPHRTDHGLRNAAHEVIVRHFGRGNWIMCCHTDEFCYHDPRRIAALAEEGGYDLVSWYSPHFYPHPSELATIRDLDGRRIPNRFHHFHWGYLDTELPWVEDRLYRNSEAVCWDGVTQGSVRPLGIHRPAPFHPIYRHYKVCSLGLPGYENSNGSSYYTHHWVGQQHRTGLPFAVRRVDDLFVDKVPKYRYCNRFEGTFPYSWNMGDEYCCRHDLPSESFENDLESVQQMIEDGRFDDAERDLLAVRRKSRRAQTKSIVCGNLGVLEALREKLDDGRIAFEAALAIDRSNATAASNLSLLNRESAAAVVAPAVPVAAKPNKRTLGRVAILSLLFNWPSTGGGTIHTKELGQCLQGAGFEMLHIFARYEPWGIGRCDERLAVPMEALSFDDSSWSREKVIARFRSAVGQFNPDHVIITDSWNFKPWLAEAAETFSYVLRYQALENLCPLNNIRLLPIGEGQVHQCGRHQLATPDLCHECCRNNSQYSGPLHNVERQFSGVGTAEYDRALRKAVGNAAAILVVNPLMQAMFSPWNERTYVVPSGIDPDRFLSGMSEAVPRNSTGRKRILFAGLIHEYMKGFHVLKRATDYLWSKRQDFELIATGEANGNTSEYLRCVGWLDQQELVRYLASSDMLVFPTIAQEALGRTAVEAMAAGIPVVASRIGGLSYTVTDNLTGLLTVPGDWKDLAQKIESLLDDPDRRKKLGENGRKRFLDEFAWPRIIEQFYKPLFTRASVN